MHERSKGIPNLLLGYKKFPSFAYFSSSYNIATANPWYSLIDDEGNPTGGEIKLYFQYEENFKSNITGIIFFFFHCC
jgi:hypothetical protein